MLFQSKTMSRHLVIGGAIKVLFFIAGMSSTYSGLADPSEPTKKNEIDVSIPDHTDNGKRPWTSLETLDSDDRFHFAIVTDRTGRERLNVFGPAMETVNLLQPSFVVSVGDLIEGYTKDRTQLKKEWDELDSFVRELDAPFFYTAGNHDYSNQVMADIWRERYGTSYYSFLYKNVLFVVLNSGLFDRKGVSGHSQRRGPWEEEQKQQLGWLAGTLQKHSDVRWTFLLMHRPYWRFGWKRTKNPPSDGPWPRYKDVVPEWVEVENMLQDRDYTAFAGHMHTYEFESDQVGPHKHEKISLATTGGISSMRGVEYGEFDHFVWVTMTEDAPVIANVLLDGILPKDIPMPLKRPYWVPAPDKEEED